MKNYSAIKNELLSFGTTWIKVEMVMSTEQKRTERQILHDLTHMWNLEKLVSCKWRVEWGFLETLKNWGKK